MALYSVLGLTSAVHVVVQCSWNEMSMYIEYRLEVDRSDKPVLPQKVK